MIMITKRALNCFSILGSQIQGDGQGARLIFRTFARLGFAAAQIVAVLALAIALNGGSAYGQEMKMEPSGVPKKNVAILVYRMVIPFDFVPAAEVFRVADHTRAFNVFAVAETSEPVKSMWPNLLAAPAYTVATSPHPDVIIVPGGWWMDMDEKGHPAVIQWLKKSAQEGATILSVCTGSYVLAKNGFLDGLSATGLQTDLNILRRLAPKAKVEVGKGYVDSGKIITTAGAANGVDAALYLVSRMLGEKEARWVADIYLDYPSWKPLPAGRVLNDTGEKSNH